VQLLYLDHVDLGEFNIPAGVTPRVMAYNKYRISNLIASDEISKVSFGARPVSHILFPWDDRKIHVFNSTSMVYYWKTIIDYMLSSGAAPLLSPRK